MKVKVLLYLDYFQYGFKVDFGMKIVLVTMLDEVCQELDMKNVLVLLDFTVASNIFDHSVLWEQLGKLGLELLLCSGSTSGLTDSGMPVWGVSSYSSGCFNMYMNLVVVWYILMTLPLLFIKCCDGECQVLEGNQQNWGCLGPEILNVGAGLPVLIGFAIPLEKQVCSLRLLLNSQMLLNLQVTWGACVNSVVSLCTHCSYTQVCSI